MFCLCPPSGTFLRERIEKKRPAATGLSKTATLNEFKVPLLDLFGPSTPDLRPDEIKVLFYLFSKRLQLNANCVSVVLLNVLCFVMSVLFYAFNQHLLTYRIFFFLLPLSLKQINANLSKRLPGQMKKAFIGLGNM